MTLSLRRLLCIGSATVSLEYTIDSLPRPGMEKQASAFTTWAGGSTGVMCAARRSGLAVAYGGISGSGPYGQIVRSILQKERIEILHPPHPHVDTGGSVFMRSPMGDMSTVRWPGAEDTFTAHDLDALPLAAGDAIFVSGHILAGKAAHILGMWLEHLSDDHLVVLDPSPVSARIAPALLEGLLQRADWVCTSLGEAAFLTETASRFADTCTQRLLALCGVRTQGVLVRCGERGAFLQEPNEDIFHVPAIKVDVVDERQAGDIHTGAFLAALSADNDPVSAVHYANAAAALALSRPEGGHAPFWAEVDEFVTQKFAASTSNLSALPLH